MIGGIKDFIASIIAEYKRISWPSRRQLFASSILVLIFTFLLAAYIGVVDFVILKAVNWVLR